MSSMKSGGQLVVISGFSGAGKGTLVRGLLKQYSDYCLSISATTRKPREGEQDGREYFFVDRERFEEMIRNDELIEYASYVGNYYGTPKAFVERMLSEGRDVILEIEIQGAKRVREQYPDALLIFVAPPNAEELKARLLGRGTETEEQVRSRLRRAAEESFYMKDYDYLLVNEDREEAVKDLHALIKSQHCRMRLLTGFAEELGQELNKLYG